jgi:cell pole-organizing protein PopZ
MSDAKAQQEPSMEEILASIRRIIAEDERPAETAAPRTEPPKPEPATSEPAADILELTERVEEEEPPPHEAAAPAHAAAASRTLEVETDIDMIGEPEPLRARGAEPRFEIGDRIVSAATSGAAAAAFARLAVVPRDRRPQGDIRLGAGDRTLEDIVRDTLRPLLQAWLDENLPDLVERLVRDEITRVVGEAGLH